jgi:hypothetical protein
MQGATNYSTRRAYRHIWADGIVEIFIGIGAIVYALFLSKPVQVSKNTNVQIVFSAVSVAVIIFVGIVLFRAVANRLKVEITYPRTGYVQLKRKRADLSARKVVLAVPVAALSSVFGAGAALGMLTVFALLKINASLLLLNAMIAGPVAGLGYRTGLTRFYGLAGVMMLVGVGLTAADMFGSGIVWMYGLNGLAILLSGVWALVRYLRAHPIQQEEGMA